MFRDKFSASIADLSDSQLPASQIVAADLSVTVAQDLVSRVANASLQSGRETVEDHGLYLRVFTSAAKFVCLGGARLSNLIHDALQSRPLSESDRVDMLDACQALLDAGADVDLKPSLLEVPLFDAATHRDAMDQLVGAVMLLAIFSRPSPKAAGKFTNEEAVELLTLVAELKSVLNIPLLVDVTSRRVRLMQWPSSVMLPGLLKPIGRAPKAGF